MDVDECQLEYCDLNAVCTNSVGSFDCSCDRGYTGDGVEGSEGCIGGVFKFKNCSNLTEKSLSKMSMNV